MSKEIIFEEKVWEKVLEKYDDLRRAAEALGVANNPEKAKEIYYRQMSKSSLEELEFRKCFAIASFVEVSFYELTLDRGKEAAMVGETEDVYIQSEFILNDFESKFEEFQENFGERESYSFQEAYEHFLDIIYLRMDSVELYTKLFVRRLLALGKLRENNILEIRKYFEDYNPKLIEAGKVEKMIEELA